MSTVKLDLFSFSNSKWNENTQNSMYRKEKMRCFYNYTSLKNVKVLIIPFIIDNNYSVHFYMRCRIVGKLFLIFIANALDILINLCINIMCYSRT